MVLADSQNMSTSNEYIKYHISAYQNSQDITNNCSSVTVHVRAWRTNTGYETYGSGTVYCKINGYTYSQAISNTQKITSSGITLFNMTLNIPHNSDGSKTLSLSAWISHDRFSSSEQSWSYALDTIPRASKPTVSASTVDFGNTITVSTNRADSSFTHHLYYSINGGSEVGIAPDITDSYTWTIPTNLINSVTNNTTAKITFRLYTFNGGDNIGNNTCSFTAHVPSTVIPTISAVDLSDTLGYESIYSGYVQNKSTIKVDVTSAGIYSSTIKKTEIKVEGATVNGSTTTSNIITTSGSKDVVVKVTDSRGRTATKTVNYTVLPYEAPKITDLRAYRSDDGANIIVTYKSTVSPLNNLNNVECYIKSKKQTETDYVIKDNVSGSYSVDKTFTYAADSDSTFDVQVNIVDDFGESSKDVKVSTAFTIIDFNNSGKGIAIGKVSEKDAFEINMDVYVNGITLEQYIKNIISTT